jgi:bla regulator protein BlaR1
MSTIDSIVNAFCWTLIHSLWQGILAAAVAGLVIISTPKASVQLRYGLLVSVVTLFLLGSGFTLFQQFGQHPINSLSSLSVKIGDNLAPAFDQKIIRKNRKPLSFRLPCSF